jgi:hypothetical protein
MPSLDRRAAGRRRAWGRGPVILKLESLERREVLSANSSLPDLVNSALITSTNTADWNTQIGVVGKVTNQGGGTTSAPTEVIIYASPVRGVDKYSVPIGEVTVPAGIGAGQSVSYQATVTLPATQIAYFDTNSNAIYITSWVNPNRAVTESNYRNDKNVGPPFDASTLVISAPKPAELVGTTFAASNSTLEWGDSFTVTAQITNDGSGASPQTRALITLTPQGINYSQNPTTVGIGNIIVPPLAPYQTVNLVQTITLPAVEPMSIANYTNFTLAMTQDADYLTNDLYPNSPTQGTGLDSTPVTITVNPDSTATTGLLPDLAASSVTLPKAITSWGSTIPVTTEVQNLGQGDAGPFTVRFILTGQSGSTTDGVFLADVTVPGLAAGASQPVTANLSIPSRAPNGLTLNSAGYARIAVIVDPENFVNSSLKSNDASVSAPFILRLPGNATTVPTQQAAGSLPSVSQVAQQVASQAKAQAAANRAARRAATTSTKTTKIKVEAPPKDNTVADKTVSVAKEVIKLPGQIVDALKKAF